MVSIFSFMFFNKFWVYSYIWNKKVVQFHFFACNCSLFQHHLTDCWPHCIFLPPFHKLIDHVYVNLFLISLLCFVVFLCLFLCQYHTILPIITLPCLDKWASYVQLCSSFLRSLSLFRVFCGSLQILGLFVPVPWKVEGIFW